MPTRRKPTADKIDRTREALDRLKSRAEAFAATDADWLAYLRHTARFWSYSANNQYLIWSQRPDTAEVAGYVTWQRTGRQVTKGSRAIWILAPRPFRAEEINDATGQTEEVERVRFRAVTVFAFEDTEPIPDYSGTPFEPYAFPRLTGDVPRALFAGFAGWLAEQGHPVSVEDTAGSGGHGWYEPATGRIVVGDHGDPLAQFGTLIHEAAHAIHFDDDAADAKTRGTAYRELVAESAAFVAAEAVGIDTSDHTVPYVGAIVSREPEVFAAAVQMIAKVSARIIAALIAIDTTPPDDPDVGRDDCVDALAQPYDDAGAVVPW